MRARVARAAAAASSAASAEVNTHASKAQTIVSRTRRMRRLCAEGEEATFIVDIEFKRINPLLQIQGLMPPESWPLSPAPPPTNGKYYSVQSQPARLKKARVKCQMLRRDPTLYAQAFHTTVGASCFARLLRQRIPKFS